MASNYTLVLQQHDLDLVLNALDARATAWQANGDHQLAMRYAQLREDILCGRCTPGGHPMPGRSTP